MLPGTDRQLAWSHVFGTENSLPGTRSPRRSVAIHVPLATSTGFRASKVASRHRREVTRVQLFWRNQKAALVRPELAHQKSEALTSSPNRDVRPAHSVGRRTGVTKPSKDRLQRRSGPESAGRCAWRAWLVLQGRCLRSMYLVCRRADRLVGATPPKPQPRMRRHCRNQVRDAPDPPRGADRTPIRAAAVAALWATSRARDGFRTV